MRIIPLIIMISIAFTAGDVFTMERPWSVSEASPTIEVSTKTQKRAGSSNNSLAALPFLLFIKGFQLYISPVDGDRCNMYPSCSSYGLHAFRKHGALKGAVLTADRLLHEYDEKNFAPRIIIKNKLYYYDPVKYNDFWWHK